jgi:hypothetical protein
MGIIVPRIQRGDIYEQSGGGGVEDAEVVRSISNFLKLKERRVFVHGKQSNHVRSGDHLLNNSLPQMQKQIVSLYIIE